MSLETFVAFDLSAGRDSKPFGRGSVGLDFGHVDLLFGLVRKLLRRKQHRHVPAFQARLDINFRDVLYLLDYPAQRLPAELRMGYLAAAKKDRHFDSLALLDELPDVTHLVFDVMCVRARSHLDFFDFNDGVFFRSVCFFSLLIPELSVVHHATDRRLSFWCDFDQI